MSNESEDSDLSRDVESSMRMFEKSKVGSAAAIMPVHPTRVLLVLDGSPQDETAVQSAGFLRGRFDVEVLVLDARDERDEDLAVAAAKQISDARAIERHDGDSYDAIVAAVQEHETDFVIVPCPFGRSFEHVGTDSAGTVIDVLLSRCPAPMLVIRRADQTLQQCVAKVSMVVGSECDMESRAAAWAFGLADSNATVSLNLVVEKEQYQNIRSIIEALTPEAVFDAEKFSDALTKTHQAIHGAMSKTASAQGMTYELKPQTGSDAPPNLMSESSKMLLVMPLEVDDRFGQGFVQDRIRRSPHPVLVVPGHVQREV